MILIKRQGYTLCVFSHLYDCWIFQPNLVTKFQWIPSFSTGYSEWLVFYSLSQLIRGISMIVVTNSSTVRQIRVTSTNIICRRFGVSVEDLLGRNLLVKKCGYMSVAWEGSLYESIRFLELKIVFCTFLTKMTHLW